MRRSPIAGAVAAAALIGGLAFTIATQPSRPRTASIAASTLTLATTPSTAPTTMAPVTVPTTEVTVTTLYQPPPTIPAPVTVHLTNPLDLAYALREAGLQRMGMNDPSQPDIQAFIANYQSDETAYQTGQTNVEPPIPQVAATAWIDTHYPIQVAANEYLSLANAVNCMIRNGGTPCPDSPTTGP